MVVQLLKIIYVKDDQKQRTLQKIPILDLFLKDKNNALDPKGAEAMEGTLNLNLWNVHRIRKIGIPLTSFYSLM